MVEELKGFDIVEEDVRGVRLRTFASAPRSLRQLWDASALFADRDYLVFGDERWTFTEAHRIVDALASRLLAEGVGRGDRVAITMRNYPEFAFAFWATIGIGAVAVPLNAWWSGPELAYGLANSGSVVLFVDGERAERLEPHLGETSVRTTFVVRAQATAPDSVTFAEALRDGGDAPTLPALDLDPDDDACIMYTSGTTGRPKGAVQTHRNFVAHLMNVLYRGALAASQAAADPGATPPPSDVPQTATLLTFPLFHVGGLQSFLMPYTAIGGKIVLMYRWDAAEAVAIVEREHVTALAGVPTTVFELLDEAARQGRSLDSVSGLASGATLVPPELVKRIDRQLASRAAPTNGYGLTETSGAAVANGGRVYLDRPDSVGTPISPVMELRIARADGTAADTGEVGEIWLKGPTVVRGYFLDDAATAAAFTDGWFHTGDLGRVDAEGYLYVVDRLKDVIIRGGENIYAAEVEAALYEHPDVVEAATVGLPDDRLGEIVAAVVRARDGSDLTPQAVIDHVAARLAVFKVPSRVWVVDHELPRNAAGKVLKRQLRDELLSSPPTA